MKRYVFKLLSMVLALLMCLSVFTLLACDSPDSGNPEESKNNENNNNVKTSIPVADIANYYLVRVENEAVVDCFKKLNTAITEKLGVTVKALCTDTIVAGYDAYSEHEFEILVGETNRDESIEFASELRYMEYGYAVVGSKIVITGKSHADTILAVEKFISDVIGAYESGSESIEIPQYICEYNHKFDELKINGTSVTEYEIVYKKTRAFGEDAIVERLQDVIGRISGHKLKAVLYGTPYATATKQIVITDSTALTDSMRDAKEALIKDTDVTDKSIIVVDENVIWLSGENMASLIGAVDNLEAIISTSTDGNVTVETGLYDTPVPQIKYMSYNVLVGSDMDKGYGPVGERKSGVIKTIRKYSPDVFGVQEASNEWMFILKKELGDTYDAVGLGRDTPGNTGGVKSTGEHSAIFYNKAKYNLIETNTYWLSDTPNKCSRYEKSEYIRIMTYAILERKSDGFRFMHVNTHLDFNETVKQKQITKMLELIDATGFKGLTFVTGDFNTLPDSGSYGLMLKAGFENSFDVANVKSQISISSMIDFCFVRDNQGEYMVENHHVANKPEDRIYGDLFPSDHNAVIATVVPVVSKER